MYLNFYYYNYYFLCLYIHLQKLVIITFKFKIHILDLHNISNYFIAEHIIYWIFKDYIHSFVVVDILYDVCYFHFIYSCHMITFIHNKVHKFIIYLLIGQYMVIMWKKNITWCLKYMISNNNGHIDTYLSQNIITHLAS